MNAARIDVSPDLSEARRLLGGGMRLVELVQYTKRPIGLEWNKHAATAINPGATGYGLPLAVNKLCSIDPDNVALARVGLRALGFDLDAWMEAGVRTRSTRPGSGGRSTFAAEAELTWVKFATDAKETILELRADSPNLQDCVPGVVYRDKGGTLCTQQYANCKRLDDAPALPDDLYAWWVRLSSDIAFLHEQQRRFFDAIGRGPNLANSTGKGQSFALAYSAPGFRGPFNRAHDVESMLEQHGYVYDRRAQRWTYSGATGAPGIYPIPGKDGLWRSDHAGDPLSGAFDAWTAFVVLDHGKDLEAAKRACEAEGLVVRPETWVPDDRSAPIDVIAAQDGGSPAWSGPAGTTEPVAPKSIVFRPLHELLATPTQVRWLLRGVLEEKVITLVAGKRGSYKSFLVLHWLLTLSRRGVPVFLVSAEGAGLARRIEAWFLKHAPAVDPATVPLFVHEQRIDFNDPVALVAVKTAIEQSGMAPRVLAIDTFSKNSGALDENSNSEVKAFIGGLDTALRTPLDLSIVLVAHTGHGDNTRVRGASAIEADTDAALIVNRIGTEPVVSVDRNRFKDAAEMPPLVYRAEVVDLGRVDEAGEPVTSVVMLDGEIQLQRDLTRKAPIGKAQQAILRALRNRRAEAPGPLIWTREDLRKVGRELGQSKSTAISAVDGLVCNGFLTATVGGHRLAEGDA